MSAITLASRFEAWCWQEGIVLSEKQKEAARILLVGMEHLGGRGSGKTFLLTMISRFLDDEPPE